MGAEIRADEADLQWSVEIQVIEMDAHTFFESMGKAASPRGCIANQQIRIAVRQIVLPVQQASEHGLGFRREHGRPFEGAYAFLHPSCPA